MVPTWLADLRTGYSPHNARTMPARRLYHPDPWLIAAVGALLALGVAMVFNASYFFAQEHYNDPFYFFRRHVAYVVVAVAGAVVVARIPWTVWERWAGVMLLGALAVLAFVLVAGTSEGGARRWVSLKFVPLTVQPSEFAKTALVVYLARYLAHRGDKLHWWWGGFLPPVFVSGLVAALLYKQPDFGTAVILLATTAAMLYAAGAKRIHMVSLAAVGAIVLLVGIVAEPYRMARVVGFRSAWERAYGDGYQLVQSMIAVGSGGLWGVGLGASQQKLLYLPAAHTDFILALIAEETGLVGVLLVLSLFGVVAWRGFRIALAHEEPFVRLLAAGLVVSLLLEAGLNFAVVLGMAPTKGLALPFVSYGGSALLGAMLRVGILLHLSRSAGL